ncbi:FMN reductase [Mesorhizobium sp. WSM3224]|uniref:FMN reductase n=1 Tax=Mesorhizobium sp. WSM3224 TaxID=1040986 RepID=UPI0004044296|nr:FMN reductase [Mesorhizobium sp. WSM3224]
MTTAAIVGFSGSYNARSRTRILVEEIVRRTALRYDKTSEVLDIGQFIPNLGAAVRLSDLNQTARRLVDRLLQADALVVASPVYKGSYTGLFKHLIDLLEPTAFSGKPVLLAATGGGDRHALVIEHQLRPLFGFFEARTLATGIYASERDFADPTSISPALAERLDRAIEQFAPYLEPRIPNELSMQASVLRANGATSQAHGRSLSRVPLASLE